VASSVSHASGARSSLPNQCRYPQALSRCPYLQSLSDSARCVGNRRNSSAGPLAGSRTARDLRRHEEVRASDGRVPDRRSELGLHVAPGVRKGGVESTEPSSPSERIVGLCSVRASELGEWHHGNAWRDVDRAAPSCQWPPPPHPPPSWRSQPRAAAASAATSSAACQPPHRDRESRGSSRRAASGRALALAFIRSRL
jgi:hypothetical protein